MRFTVGGVLILIDPPASERSTALRICAGTGATPGRNKRTSAGSIRCRCSSTADPNA